MLQIAICVLASYNSRTGVTLPAGIMSSSLALLLLALSFLHTKAQRPSATIVVCHGFLALVEIVRCRTYWLAQQQPTAVLLVSSVILRAVVVVHESFSYEHKGRSREETAGILNRSFFQWLVPLLLRGYRVPLASDDLPAFTDRAMYSENLEDKFSSLLRPHSDHDGRLNAKGLVIQTAKCLGYSLLYPMVPRLALVGFKVAQLYVVRTLLQYVQHGTLPTSYGYGLIGACAFTYIGSAVSVPLRPT